MKQSAKTYRNFLPTAMTIYIAVVTLFVVCAWIFDHHPLDLGLTVSKYIGLQPWSSIVYFFASIIFCAILAIPIIRSEMQIYRKILYLLLIIGVIGCAWFPCTPTRTLAKIHNYFSNGLVLGIALTLIITTIVTKSQKQRIFAIISLLYLAGFIFCYIQKVLPLFQTIFIWENLIFFILFFELLLEPIQTTKSSSSSHE